MKDPISCRKPEDEITKMLHFVFISDDMQAYNDTKIPDKVQAHINEWRSLHPKWEVKVWDNLSINQEFPDLVKILARLHPLSFVSNLIGYHVLERYGGIYLGSNITSFRSLEPLRIYPIFTVCQDPLQSIGNHTLITLRMAKGECKLACNAVIGSRPHHPALQQVIKESMEHSQKRLQLNQQKPAYDSEITSPLRWSSVVAGYPDVVWLRSFTFYSCKWTQKRNCTKENFNSDPKIFGMHMWEG